MYQLPTVPEWNASGTHRCVQKSPATHPEDSGSSQSEESVGPHMRRQSIGKNRQVTQNRSHARVFFIPGGSQHQQIAPIDVDLGISDL